MEIRVDALRNAVALKPWFILLLHRRLRGRPLLYVDADMVFEQAPVAVFEAAAAFLPPLPSAQDLSPPAAPLGEQAAAAAAGSREKNAERKFDMMMYNFNAAFGNGNGNVPRFHTVAPSAALFFNPTRRAEGFLADWCAATAIGNNAMGPDDHLLVYVHDYSTCGWRQRLSVGQLPRAYVRYRTLTHFSGVAPVIDPPEGLDPHTAQLMRFEIPLWQRNGEGVSGFISVDLNPTVRAVV